MLLRELRKERNMTQKQLEEKSGVDQAHISELERGKNQTVQLSTLRKLAGGLGVTVSELIGEK